MLDLLVLRSLVRRRDPASRKLTMFLGDHIPVLFNCNYYDINFDLLRSKRFGRYGTKVKSSSSSPTARYADFMAMLEIARMYPEQIPPEVVVENSTLANKDLIAQQVSSVESVKSSVGSVKKKINKKTV